MSNRLSHSAATRFQRCAKSYDYHYNKGYRSKNTSAALLMGSAVDKACEALMKDPSVDALAIFINAWTIGEINKVPTNLVKCTNIIYAEADYDSELLTEENWEYIDAEIKHQFDGAVHETPQEFVKSIYETKSNVGFENLQSDLKVILNYANWLCLRAKGLLMIDAVKRDFVPYITKVHSAQERVDLVNEEGDSIIGFIDLVASWQGYNKPIILDFKTSARRYDEDTSVIMSPQLSLYVNAVSEKYENTRLAGFLVLSKQIKKNRIKICTVCGHDGTGFSHKTCNNEATGKRCKGEWKETIKPEATTQTIIAEIPERTEEIVMENISHINDSIKNGIFHRNLNACNSGFACEFIDMCWKGDYSKVININETDKSKT